MFSEVAGIRKIILAVGYTDLRKGVDSLAQLLGTRYDLNSLEKDGKVNVRSAAFFYTGAHMS